jgi:hypothetical protein
MASNFKISSHRNSNTLHLKLTGDFDGTSACELLNVLKKNTSRVNNVFIHTGCLNNVYPFGRDTFKKNLCDLKGRSIRLMFTGSNAIHLAPEKACVFNA